ncbi:cytidine deaminase [Flavobacteriaceae bacterium MAR_2010_188]|nr:cytidine deaminase [Flavobacteriaceae bacterium MAR_2010_188]
MKKVTLETNLDVFDNIDELPDHAKNLIYKAIDARKKAYAPYSKFAVGVAISLENGEVITGNNQENASYPSGLCAERTAIFYAGSQYPDVKILTMALTAGSLTSNTITPIPPCGACRQSIAEYEVKQDSPIEIFFMGETGKVVRSESLKNILPLIFDGSLL